MYPSRQLHETRSNRRFQRSSSPVTSRLGMALERLIRQQFRQIGRPFAGKLQQQVPHIHKRLCTSSSRISSAVLSEPPGPVGCRDTLRPGWSSCPAAWGRPVAGRSWPARLRSWLGPSRPPDRRWHTGSAPPDPAVTGSIGSQRSAVRVSKFARNSSASWSTGSSTRVARWAGADLFAVVVRFMAYPCARIGPLKTEFISRRRRVASSHEITTSDRTSRSELYGIRRLLNLGNICG